ncbi:FeoB-associated Cys-rich membrane protein [Capnocytophaga sp. HP1101]
MNAQEIITYILVVIAVGYLVKTLFFKKKKKSCGGGPDCKCG